MTSPTTLTRRAPHPAVRQPSPPAGDDAFTPRARPGAAFVPVEREPAPEKVERRPAGTWDAPARMALAGWFTAGSWLFLAASPDGVPVVEAAFELTWGVLSLAACGFYLDHRTSTSKTVRPILAPVLRLLAGGALRAPLTAPVPAARPVRELPAPAASQVVRWGDELDELRDDEGRPVVVGVLVSDLPTDPPNTYAPAAEEATR